MTEYQESSIPGVPLSESMKEFDQAHKDGLRDGLFELTTDNPNGPIRLTRKGWRVTGYAMATMSMVERNNHLFGETDKEGDELLQFGRVALDMAAWMKLNPGSTEYRPYDGQHK